MNSIENEIQNYIDQNREHLPYNFSYWKIKVFKEESQETNPISTERNNTIAGRSSGFYKPISKMIVFKHEEK